MIIRRLMGITLSIPLVLASVEANAAGFWSKPKPSAPPAPAAGVPMAAVVSPPCVAANKQFYPVAKVIEVGPPPQEVFEIAPETVAEHQEVFRENIGDGFDYTFRESISSPEKTLHMTPEGALAQLSNTELVFIIDRSGSTQTPDTPAMRATRMRSMLRSGGAFTRFDSEYAIGSVLASDAYKVDTNGIPVISFGNTIYEAQTFNPQDLLNVFYTYRPTDEATNLNAALEYAFQKYAHVKDVRSGKRTLFIILTDGEPTDFTRNPDPTWAYQQIRQTIYNYLFTKDPTGNFLSALFVRVGSDLKAITFLQWLDDCADIGNHVDTQSDNQVGAVGGVISMLKGMYEAKELEDAFPEDEDLKRHEAQVKGYIRALAAKYPHVTSGPSSKPVF